MMMCPVNTAFKLRPEAFDGVGVATASNVFLRAVVDDLVAIAKLGDVVIGGILVSVNLRPWLNCGANLFDCVGSADSIHNNGLNPTTALHNAN